MDRTMRTRAGIGVLAAAATTIGAAACTPAATSVTARRELTALSLPPSVLTVVVGPGAAGDIPLMRAVLIKSARPGERLIAVSMTNGTVLGSFTAPRPQRMAVPGPPTRPEDPTTFQRDSYRRARAAYAATLSHDRARLRARQQAALKRWAARAARLVSSGIARLAPGPGAAAAFAVAVTAAANIRAAGVRIGTRRVIAVFGLSGAGAFLRRAHLDLTGTGVVVADCRGDSADDAALQASLLQSAASSAVVLTQATDGLLPGVVERELDGTVAYKLAHIHYGAAQYRLPASADASLRSVLALLETRYPNSTAMVNGYTDSVPVPGGNVALSWKRAEAVVAWLIKHGVARDRLLAVGHGAADPQYPNRRSGQPGNRRVVIVIQPGI